MYAYKDICTCIYTSFVYIFILLCIFDLHVMCVYVYTTVRILFTHIYMYVIIYSFCVPGIGSRFGQEEVCKKGLAYSNAILEVPVLM